MNLFEFMSGSPILTILLAYLILLFLEGAYYNFLKCLVIWKQGYPPVHCDATGKPREGKDEDVS